jgi:hypothetical protein
VRSDPLALVQQADAGLMARNVALHLRLGGGKFLLRLVDGVHDDEFLLLQLADLGLHGFDLDAQRAIFVVLADFELLGAVAADLLLGFADFGFEQFLFRLELHQLGPGALAGRFLGNDLRLHARHLVRHGLQLPFEVAPLLVATLEDEKFGEDGRQHVAPES